MSGEILQREIYEQPDVVARFLACEHDHIENIAQRLRGRFHYMVIAARGTSDNAARYAKYIFGAHNQMPISLATPSLFTLYRQPPVMDGALVLGISQSGRSPDILSVIREAHDQGQPTLAITNDPDSPLAMSADDVILLNAGPEKAIAATKTYTTSLMALGLLSSHMTEDKVRLRQLQELPVLLERTLDSNSVILEQASRFRTKDHYVVIGRGYNYATAFEISLKIKELTQTLAEPYSSADFLHGPIALIHPGFPIIIISPHGSVFENLGELVERLKSLEGELLIISNNEELLAEAHLAMPIPSEAPEWISPLLTVLPGQLFSLGLARARGLDPDNPRGLTKITETW